LRLEAVVFDFDGVIANSEPLHFRAYERVLAQAGVTLSERDYFARYLGFDDVGAFAALARDRGLTWTRDDVAALVARKATELEALERDVSVLFPGAAEAIARAAAMVPIAIASGARGEEIRRVLRRAQLDTFFTAIVSAEDTAVSKPSPEPYLRALALLRAARGTAIDAARCVAIEACARSPSPTPTTKRLSRRSRMSSSRHLRRSMWTWLHRSPANAANRADSIQVVGLIAFFRRFAGPFRLYT
jgi:beta-phosphoglucomutase